MNKKLLLVTTVAMATTGLYSTSLLAASVTANAHVTVLAPLDITAGAAMDFGDVSGDIDNDTTVVLTTGGAASSTDGAAITGSPQAGAFTVDGAGNFLYTISLPGSILLTGGGDDMTVDSFNHDAGANPALSGGTDSFSVGATLTINADQAPGDYNGTYDVTVEYQ